MSDCVQHRLARAGLELPASAPAAADYVPCTFGAGAAYVSGQTPRLEGELVHPGIVGVDVTPEQAADAAKLCALRSLAALRDAAGGLDMVTGVARLSVYVRSAPGVTTLSSIADAASEVMRIAFGDAGRHARTTIGVAALPGGACVELDAIFLMSQERT